MQRGKHFCRWTGKATGRRWQRTGKEPRAHGRLCKGLSPSERTLTAHLSPAQQVLNLIWNKGSRAGFWECQASGSCSRRTRESLCCSWYRAPKCKGKCSEWRMHTHLRVHMAVDHCGSGKRSGTQLPGGPKTLPPVQVLQKLIYVSDGYSGIMKVMLVKALKTWPYKGYKDTSTAFTPKYH